MIKVGDLVDIASQEEYEAKVIARYNELLWVACKEAGTLVVDEDSAKLSKSEL